MLVRPRVYVEPFAGAAAVLLTLALGLGAVPLVSWMGGKRTLAERILRALRLSPRAGFDRAILLDVGPWGDVWPAILDRRRARRVAAQLRAWRGTNIRDLWFELAVAPFDDPDEAVAQWLVLQARAGGGAPAFWSTEAHPAGEGTLLQGELPPVSLGRAGELRKARVKLAGQKGEHGRPRSTILAQGAPRGETKIANQKGERARPLLLQGSPAPRPPQPAGQRNANHVGLVSSDGRGQLRLAGQKGGGERGSVGGGGLVRIETLARRVDGLALSLDGLPIEAYRRDAGVVEELLGEDLSGVVIYADPPYEGATSYGWDIERDRLLRLCERWVALGARVGLSEAVPLDDALDGVWTALDLTPHGYGKPEFLTVDGDVSYLSPEPEQLALSLR